MANTNQNTVWKPYPDYPFIEANQFGKVRTKDHYVPVKGGGKLLVRGHMLKQYFQKNGYLYVSFGFCGKKIHLLVHRIVATCFLSSPDNLPEVNHIDNDPTNNTVSNLEWCTHQENMVYKEKYGVPAKEATKILRKPVFAINLETLEVLRFESQHEAARQLGINQGNINNVLRGQLKTVNGFWFTENESEITEKKIQEIKSTMNFFGGVIGINLETLEVFYFKSRKDAERKLGVFSSNIGSVIKGQRNKTGGYWFCCADEKTIEKVKTKFGDKVASDVEKLMV